MIGIHRGDLEIYLTTEEIDRFPEEKLEGQLLDTVPENPKELCLTAETSTDIAERMETEMDGDLCHITLSDQHYKILKERGWTNTRKGGFKVGIYNRESLDPLEKSYVSSIDERLEAL